MDLDVTAVLVSRYQAASAEQREEVLHELVQRLQKKEFTILAVVAALQDYLINEESERRLLGTELLAQLLARAADALSGNDLHHLALFMSARLTDWPCTGAAADACSTLLQRAAPNTAPALSEEDSVSVVRTAADQLAPHIQQLTQKDRSRCLNLLLTAAQGPSGVLAAKSGVNLVEGCIAAIDGEKDPRCLLMAFGLVQAVCDVYHTKGVDVSPLVDQSEEVVEVLSCYFPLTFNPPKSDPHRITRADLAAALMRALSSSPFLVKWALPLIIEKLSSTYRPAKEDAMAALSACCQSCGKDALLSNVSEVWTALRSEVLGPVSVGTAADELSTARQLSAAACLCLTQCARGLGPSATLTQCATGDTYVREALDSILSQGGEVSQSNTQERRVECLASALGAVAAGGSWSAQQVSSVALEPVLRDVQGDAGQPLQPVRARLALTWCRHTFDQVRTSLAAVSSDSHTRGVLTALSSVSVQAVQACVRVIGACAPPQSNGVTDTSTHDTDTARTQCLLAATGCITAVSLLHTPTHDTQPVPPSTDSVSHPASVWSHTLYPDLVRLLVGVALSVSPSDTENTPDTHTLTLTSGGVGSPQAAGAAEPWQGALSAAVAVLRGVTATQQADTASGQDVCSAALQPAVSALQELSGHTQGAEERARVRWLRAVCVCRALCQGVSAVSASLLSQLSGLVPQALTATHTCDDATTGGRTSLVKCEELLALASTCLHSLSSSTPSPATSEVARQFTLALLRHQSPTVQSASHQRLSVTAAALAGQLTAACTVADQSGLLQVACEQVQLSQQARTSGTQSCMVGLVPCAVLAAASPSALPPDTALQPVCGQLLAAVTAAGTGTNAQRGAAAVSLASIVNKRPEMPGLVPQAVLAAGLSDAGSVSAHALNLCVPHAALPMLPWLAAGVARSRSPIFTSITSAVIDSVAQQTLVLAAAGPTTPTTTEDTVMCNGDHQHSEHSSQYAAIQAALLGAEAMRVVFSDTACVALGEGSSAEGQGIRWHHMQCRPLWQQRSLHAVLDTLCTRLSSSADARTHQALQLMLATLISTQPLALLRPHLNRLVPMFPSCMTALLGLFQALLESGSSTASQSPAHTDHVTLMSRTREGMEGLIRLTASVAGSEDMGTALHDSIGPLLSAVCPACRLKGCPSVREAALKLLSTIIQHVPYHLLHPFRQEVIDVVSQALDDDKRAVRKAATVCRQLWSRA